MGTLLPFTVCIFPIAQNRNPPNLDNFYLREHEARDCCTVNWVCSPLWLNEWESKWMTVSSNHWWTQGGGRRGNRSTWCPHVWKNTIKVPSYKLLWQIKHNTLPLEKTWWSALQDDLPLETMRCSDMYAALHAGKLVSLFVPLNG